jgi:16S rRNA (uracil1498-N3)-methyltransferase
VGQAEVIRASREEVVLMVEGTARVPAPSPCLVLAAALVQGGRFDQIVDQATQLGASEIIPLVTSRTVVKPSADRCKALASRFRQIALEACRQSGVNHLPLIHPVTDFKKLVPALAGCDLVVLGALEGEREALTPLLSRRPMKRLLLLIGPEGDFTPEEIGQARKAGAHPFAISPNVLRCETAAAAALGVISFLLQENSP